MEEVSEVGFRIIVDREEGGLGSQPLIVKILHCKTMQYMDLKN